MCFHECSEVNNLSIKKQTWRWMYLSERRGKFWLWSRRENDKANGGDNFCLFPAFFVWAGYISSPPWVFFFFFHADWSTAGLSQLLDSEERRTWRIEGKKRIERGVGDRHSLWQRCLSWWSVGSKLEACFKGERRERGVGVGMNKKPRVHYLTICRVCDHEFL